MPWVRLSAIDAVGNSQENMRRSDQVHAGDITALSAFPLAITREYTNIDVVQRCIFTHEWKLAATITSVTPFFITGVNDHGMFGAMTEWGLV